MSRTVIVPNEINEVMNAKMSVKEPFVGLLGTMFVGSDRYAVVITEVVNKKEVKVVKVHEDAWLENATKHGDNGDFVDINNLALYLAAQYMFDVMDGKLTVINSKTYTLRKNGRWMPKGDGMWGTCSIHFGTAENYMDPSF